MGSARWGTATRVLVVLSILGTHAQAAEPASENRVQAPPTYDRDLPAPEEPRARPHGEEPDATPPEPFEPVPARSRSPARTWYGWQTAIVDGVAMGGGAVFAGVPDSTSKLPPLARFGFTWWIATSFAEPVVHFAHKRVAIGFADLGMRIGLPFVATFAGVGVSCGGTSSSDCSKRNAAYGLIVGVTLAAILDATLFAYDAPKKTPRIAPTGAWIPAVVPLKGGAVVSLGRVF